MTIINDKLECIEQLQTIGDGLAKIEKLLRERRLAMFIPVYSIASAIANKNAYEYLNDLDGYICQLAIVIDKVSDIEWRLADTITYRERLKIRNREIIKARDQGEDYKEIATKYNLSIKRVEFIISRRNYYMSN